METIPDALKIALQYHRAGQLQPAEAIYRRILEVDPNHPDALHLLGVIANQVGRFQESAELIQRAISFRGNEAMFHNNLASVFSDLGRFDDAITSYRRAVELKPDYAEAHNNLGTAYMERHLQDQAVICHRRAIELQPDYAEAYNSLGNAYKEMRQLDAAIQSYRRALELKPNFVMAHSNMLCTMQYRQGVTMAELAEAHADYDQRHARTFLPDPQFDNIDKNPNRRLRLGFVSPDLRKHPVGSFLVRVFENLDRNQTETVCYSNLRFKDSLTNRFEALATQWRDVIGITDDVLAAQIRADKIDILFDLAGHTAKNRLMVFARKPAPIQVTWAGYVGTTGLRTMDYLLADRFEVPPESESCYCERILRMPDDYITYDPPPYAPEVRPLPAFHNGYVTFGCFNTPAKITSRVIAVWSTILKRVPRSRLCLKYKGMDTPGFATDLLAEFAQNGIDSHRIELMGMSGHAKQLECYGEIDVCLDPFPYSGGLTTCEALWMGVPVVTCPGETFASRHSFTHLMNIGMTETIARNLDDYIELAVSLAADLPRLSDTRAGLRSRVLASPLCDGKRFADNFLIVLRQAWKNWVSESA